MDAKPIETRFRGYRFRSRLEARWAVFFDALGVPWEYEKEGYTLPDGTRYLPDFWLPNQRWWWEVKGPEPSQEEKEKCRQLRDGTGRPVFLTNGTPPDHVTTIFCWDVGGSTGGASEWDVARFIYSRAHPLIPCICTSHTLYQDRCIATELAFIACDVMGETFLHRKSDAELLLPETTPVDQAYAAARAARFEHGEQG